VEKVDWSVQRYDTGFKKLNLSRGVWIYDIENMIPQSENPLYNARENRNTCIILVIIILFIVIMFFVI
jgi:hypothetical protein